MKAATSRVHVGWPIWSSTTRERAALRARLGDRLGEARPAATVQVGGAQDQRVGAADSRTAVSPAALVRP